MDRAKTVAILKEIFEKGGNPSRVVLQRIQSDSFELHYTPTVLRFDEVRKIAESHNLKCGEENGKIIIC